MIPAGYLLKRMDGPPGWLQAPGVVTVCNVAACESDDVVDVQKVWRHNGLGVANSIAVLRELAGPVADGNLFYYEVYEREMPSDGWTFDAGRWRPLGRVPSAGEELAPEVPSPPLRLLGYDVVVSNDYVEHSPLFCNSIAETADVNAFCLFDTLEQAISAVEGGVFGGGCEEGIYRIYSVSEVEDPIPSRDPTPR